jgi:hypothetical protein
LEHCDIDSRLERVPFTFIFLLGSLSFSHILFPLARIASSFLRAMRSITIQRRPDATELSDCLTLTTQTITHASTTPAVSLMANSSSF